MKEQLLLSLWRKRCNVTTAHLRALVHRKRCCYATHSRRRLVQESLERAAANMRTAAGKVHC